MLKGCLKTTFVTLSAILISVVALIISQQKSYFEIARVNRPQCQVKKSHVGIQGTLIEGKD
jgi:hypothetical protein